MDGNQKNILFKILNHLVKLFKFINYLFIINKQISNKLIYYCNVTVALCAIVTLQFIYLLNFGLK